MPSSAYRVHRIQFGTALAKDGLRKNDMSLSLVRNNKDTDISFQFTPIYQDWREFFHPVTTPDIHTLSRSVCQLFTKYGINIIMVGIPVDSDFSTIGTTCNIVHKYNAVEENDIMGYLCDDKKDLIRCSSNILLNLALLESCSISETRL